MRNYIKAGMCSILTSLMLLAAGCLPAGLSADAARRPQPTFNGNAWVTYWDFDRGLKEAVKIQSQLNSVSYFAAAFDRNNRIMLMGPAQKFTAQKFTRYRAEIKKYLTVVNDVYKDVNNPAGESIEKDTQVLFSLFETDESMRSHSQDLLAGVKKHHFDGLEIDYENIWKNPQLAKKFVRFLKVLVPAAEEAKIPLRIILEPGVPVSAYELPEAFFGQNGRCHCVCLWQNGAGFTRRDSTPDIASIKEWEIAQNDGVYDIHFTYCSSIGKPVRTFRHAKKPIITESMDYLQLPLKEKAFTLNRDLFYGRLLYNGRLTDVDTGEWYYQTTIVNLLFTEDRFERNLFVSRQPDVVYRQLERL